MNNFAYLKRTNPFYDLFPDGRCPIINIIMPSQAELEGHGVADVYMIDLSKIEEQRVYEIARRLAEKAGPCYPPQDVLREIMERGLPLRVSETTGCETDCPWLFL